MSILPKRPARPRSPEKRNAEPRQAPQKLGAISSMGVIDTKTKHDKTVLEQLAETIPEFTTASIQEDELIAKHGLGERKVYAGTSYNNEPVKARVSSMPLPPPPVRRNSALPPITYSYTAPNGEERGWNFSERDGIILDAIIENRRLTMQQIAYVVAFRERKALANVMASIRSSNIYKLLSVKEVDEQGSNKRQDDENKGGFIKKITPRKGSPFYILTEAGHNYYNKKLPVESALLKDTFDEKNLDQTESDEISALASTVLKFETGQMKLKAINPRTGKYQPIPCPMLPVLTPHRIRTEGKRLGTGKKALAFQENAINTWLMLPTEQSGMERFPDGSWELGDTTLPHAEKLYEAIRANFAVMETVANGREIWSAATPAALFCNYNTEGEIDQLVDFVIAQPHKLVKVTGGYTIMSGCAGGIVENILQEPQYYKYLLYMIYNSPIPLTQFFVITHSAEIERVISLAWKELVSENRVPNSSETWIVFGEYDLINSTSEPLGHWQNPTAGKNVGLNSQG